MGEIKGRVALVTGGGSGIGKGLAVTLAKEGARVVVADIHKSTAEATAAEIRAAGGSAIGILCDVCDRDAVRETKAEANRAFGAVSLLFANAGATSYQTLTEMSDGDVDWIFTVNLMGVINCLRTFLPDMIAAREGHVVATASTAGLMPAWHPVHSAYASAKMGVIGMMMNVRLELAEHGVGASVYCPGGVATGMKEGNATYRPARFGGPGTEELPMSKEFLATIKHAFLAPELVAKVVLLAVRENRPIILDHSEHRDLFIDGYVNPVLTAFDQAAAFEKEMGIKIGSR